MNKDQAKRWLKKVEWSMGNGQCPCCDGLSKEFYPENKPKDLGHKKTCGLAAAMLALGMRKPLYLGQSKLADKYRAGWVNGYLAMVPKDKPLTDEEKRIEDDLTKTMKNFANRVRA